MMKLILTLGILVLAGGAAYVIGWSGIFEIKKISCLVDREKECSVEIRAELDKYLNKNLLTLRHSQIEKRVVTAERLAKSAKADLILPDSLKVNIVSRRALAAITTTENVSEQVEVDNDGVILGKSENGDELPRLVWPEIANWPIEKPVPQNIVRAAVISGLAGDRFQVQGIGKVESESTMVITLNFGEKIFLSLAKDPVEQLRLLQVVLNQVRIEGKLIQEIDLRFDRPVIR